MKHFQCDLCEKIVVEGWDLTELQEAFRIPGVEHVCLDCNSQLDSVRNKFDRILSKARISFMKSVVLKFKNTFKRK